MADSIIRARAEKFARALRQSFRKIGNYDPAIDEPIIEEGRRRYMRCLAGEKGRRAQRRKRQEQTLDLFDEPKEGRDAVGTRETGP